MSLVLQEAIASSAADSSALLELVQPSQVDTTPTCRKPEPREIKQRTVLSWGLKRISFTTVNDSKVEEPNIFRAWYTGKPVKIFVLDSGVNAVADLSPTGRLVTAVNVTEDVMGHGTHVAAIAAGTSSGIATVGLGWHACRIVLYLTPVHPNV